LKLGLPRTLINQAREADKSGRGNESKRTLYPAVVRLYARRTNLPAKGHEQRRIEMKSLHGRISGIDWTPLMLKAVGIVRAMGFYLLTL
jgi:hypothetical protein